MEPAKHCQHGDTAMLQLHRTKVQDLLLALAIGDARRIPEILREGPAGAGNGLLRRRQGAQGRVRVEGPVSPSLTCEAVLEEHPDDGHHGQPSIGDLGRQLLFLAAGWRLDEAVGNAQEARVFKVARSPLGIIHVLKQLHRAGEGHHLRPATQGNLAEGGEACWHVAELQTQRWRQITRPAVVLRHNVSQAGEHGHPTMLEFHIATATEGRGIIRFGEAQGVPEPHRRLHSKL
mmetsp:Transcript_75769/g.120054  ORF Transcript_75769/g.120054 Transcript_75769/m.120054 type:complete len:233 (-) Transcript_75769:872-1570(-)